jgi:hypothetical protein
MKASCANEATRRLVELRLKAKRKWSDLPAEIGA